MANRLESAIFDDASPHLDRFGLLLAITALAIVGMSLIDLEDPFTDLGNELAWVLATVLISAMFLLALRASGVARRWRRIADVLVGVVLVFSFGLLLLDIATDVDLSDVSTNVGPSPVWLVLAALSPIVVVRRLLKHRQVTRRTLLGAISAYLLIAVALTFAFFTINAYQAEPFFGEETSSTAFMYYSLVTVTTLGYGDLTAATDVGRLMSTIGAVIGQVYLVTFVALLVGLVAQTWRSAKTT
jgi:hypothetical protein